MLRACSLNSILPWSRDGAVLNGAANGAFHRWLGCQQERFETEEAKLHRELWQGMVLVMSNRAGRLVSG